LRGAGIIFGVFRSPRKPLQANSLKNHLSAFGRCGNIPAFPIRNLIMAYAIIRSGGKQYRVSPGETIAVEKIDAAAGDKVTFGDVVLHADGSAVTAGGPLISGAKVTGEVIEQFKDKKVIAFKYKRRKGYHRTVGHRRQLTRVKIEAIDL
jgi:large subunit ribosomal protein L21